MSAVDPEILAISFAPEGAIVQYMQAATDVRVKGALVMQRQLMISASHDDYREDIVSLHDKAVRMLRNALEDFEESEPWDPTAGRDEDDDTKGMGE